MGPFFLKLRALQVRKLLAAVADPTFRRGLRHGVATAIEHRRLLSGIALSTVVDVGANVGQFTLLIRGTHPAARVIAFEPQSGPADRFARLFARDSQVKLHRVAIGPTAGRAVIHVTRSNDSSSLLAAGEGTRWLGAGVEEVGTEAVTLAPLSDLVAPGDLIPPALLKLDVQGFELEALAGCADLLSLFDYVYAEVSFVPLYANQPLAREVIAWLGAHDFGLEGVGDTWTNREGRCIQADFLFKRT
jgi:FkbM family methyltransferase